MPKTKKAVVPRLRFPEFRDAGPWEVKKIGDVFDVRSSKRVLEKDWKTEGVPFYRTRELVSLWNNSLVYPEVYISETLFNELAERYGVPKQGDFLVSGVGTLGVAYQVRSDDRFYFKDGNVLWLKKKEDIVSTFFEYSFYSSIVQNQVFGQAAISTVGTYTIQNAKQTLFACPPSEEEQQKIADCLSSLDEVIELEAKRLEALKAHKKGLLQQLFPREGETTPRLRFPEFRDAGPWEVKRLRDLLTYERPDKYIVQSENYTTHGIPVLTANKGFILGYTLEQHGIFDDVPVIIFDDFTTDKKFVDFPFKVKSSAIKIFKQKGENSIRFLAELMSLIHFDPQQHKRYYISEYQNIAVRVPAPEEQQKIADCLSSLDELIELQAKRLEALKAHKQGLLQQLFPQELY